jgi:hypothetical protein
MEEPRLDSIPDLLQDLDCFVGAERADLCDFTSDINGGFHMAQYREHILSILGRGSRMFSDIAPVIEDNRQDTIRRFVTLIFMQHEGEVALTQYDNRILVERASNETDN